MMQRRVSDFPLWRRAVVWALAPLVADWRGLSLTRLVVVAGVVRIYDVNENLVQTSWQEVTLWALLLVASIAKDARELSAGFKAIFSRRSSDSPRPPEVL